MKTVAFFDAKTYDRESFLRFKDDEINIRFFENKLHGRLPDDREKKRLTDALLRRGYSWGDVKSAWSRLGSESWEE